MFGSRKKEVADFVEPDLPITPMLDMSFQLMAFFIFTFRPTPTEGQLLLALPKEEGGPAASIPNPADEQPVKLVVRVEADANGRIAKMSIREEGAANPIPTELGADVKGAYQPELTRRFQALGTRPGKLTLEIGNGLLQGYVVQLYDVARNVGFAEIAPVPLDPKRR